MITGFRVLSQGHRVRILSEVCPISKSAILATILLQICLSPEARNNLRVDECISNGQAVRKGILDRSDSMHPAQR